MSTNTKIKLKPALEASKTMGENKGIDKRGRDFEGTILIYSNDSKFRYYLSKSVYSGNCDVCKDGCSEFYIQCEEELITLSDGVRMWARHQGSMVLGHYNCLESLRKI